MVYLWYSLFVFSNFVGTNATGFPSVKESKNGYVDVMINLKRWLQGTFVYVI